MTVNFDSNPHSLDEEVSRVRSISNVISQPQANHIRNEVTAGTDSDNTIFSVPGIVRRIAAMKIMADPDEENQTGGLTLKRPNEGSGKSDVKDLPTFSSKGRHADVSPEDLSQRWHISVSQAAQTLKKTTQKFLRSAILPLSRRYRSDRMFDRKTLSGEWATDTFDGRCKSLDGNRYAQVFANSKYFSRIYPMDSKSKAGDALKTFCQEFGIPHKLTFDGSKEQVKKGVTFMKTVKHYNIDYHIIEPDLHNQNPAEGVIREIRKKWYRTMVRKRVPKQLWDYGVVWCS